MAAYLNTNILILGGGGESFVNYKYLDNTANTFITKQLLFS
jgi:hypothetical protein